MVSQRDHDDVGALDRFGAGEHFEAFFTGYLDGLGTFVEADDDVASGLFEVQRVGVALGAEAEHSEGFAFEDAQVGVLVGVHFSHKCEIEAPIMGIFRSETRRSVNRSACCLKSFDPLGAWLGDESQAVDSKRVIPARRRVSDEP